MPSVHLRLTERELAQLQAWAEDGHRSVQKEIVYRLFRARSLSEREGTGSARSGEAETSSTPRRSRSDSDPYFKSDFKGGKKRSGAAAPLPSPAAPESPPHTGARVVNERASDLKRLAEPSAPVTATPQAPQSSGVGAATPSPAAPPGAEDSFKPDFKKEKPKRTGFRK